MSSNGDFNSFSNDFILFNLYIEVFYDGFYINDIINYLENEVSGSISYLIKGYNKQYPLYFSERGCTEEDDSKTTINYYIEFKQSNNKNKKNPCTKGKDEIYYNEILKKIPIGFYRIVPNIKNTIQTIKKIKNDYDIIVTHYYK